MYWDWEGSVNTFDPRGGLESLLDITTWESEKGLVR